MTYIRDLTPLQGLKPYANDVREALEIEVAPAYDHQRSPLEGLNEVYVTAYTKVTDNIFTLLKDFDDEEKEHDETIDELQQESQALQDVLTGLDEHRNLEPAHRDFQRPVQAATEFAEQLQQAIDEAL